MTPTTTIATTPTTPMGTPTTTTSTRGYLLLEILASGAIIATAMLGLVTQLADARVGATGAHRERVAARLVSAELEEARARAADIRPGVLRREIMRVGGGSYDVLTIAGPETEEQVPGPNGTRLVTRYIPVQVEASFEVQNILRQAVATTRLYR